MKSEMDISDDIKNAYYDGYDSGYNAGFEAGQHDVLLKETQLSREGTTSSDCISRQAAIDALNDEFTIIGKTNAIVVQDYIRRVNNRLHNLPSAQPEPCEDAVSREAVSKWLKQYGQDVLHGKYKFSLMYIWKNLMDLPSVTPKQRWIPCRVNNPREYGCYQVTTKDGAVVFRWYSTVHGWERHGDEVLAWLPLPEPYRAERRTDETD